MSLDIAGRALVNQVLTILESSTGQTTPQRACPKMQPNTTRAAQVTKALYNIRCAFRGALPSSLYGSPAGIPGIPRTLRPTHCPFS